MIVFCRLCVTPILVDYKTGFVGNLISLSFHAYEEHPNAEIDSKSDFAIPIWIGSPPCCAHLIVSPSPS
jgi:hypothetical protein